MRGHNAVCGNVRKREALSSFDREDNAKPSITIIGTRIDSPRVVSLYETDFPPRYLRVRFYDLSDFLLSYLRIYCGYIDPA